jgi:hypothetical protein
MWVGQEIQALSREIRLGRASTAERLHRQLPTECPVSLEMPFAAHGMPSVCTALGVEEYPLSAPRRTCALAGIMCDQAPCDVVGPTDVSEVAIFCDCAEHVHVAVHSARYECQRIPDQRVSNEPVGTTGWAPASRPLLLAGGVV